MQRASQCESVAPIAAYYTRFAGMLKGLALKPLHPDIEAVLVAMMTKLEADKARLGLAGHKDPAEKAKDEDELRSFALKVFAIADRTDQMGARDAKLLNKYMSARTFLQAFEIISDDELPQKEAELLKYCNVRCYQISKSLKAGEPVPAPPALPGADTQPDNDSSDAALDQQLAKEEAAAAARAAAPRPQMPPPGAMMPDSGSFPDLPTPPPAPEASPSPPAFPAYFTAGANSFKKKSCPAHFHLPSVNFRSVPCHGLHILSGSARIGTVCCVHPTPAWADAAPANS